MFWTYFLLTSLVHQLLLLISARKKKNSLGKLVIDSLRLRLPCVLSQGGEALSGFLSHQLYCGPNTAGTLCHPQDPGKYESAFILGMVSQSETEECPLLRLGRCLI